MRNERPTISHIARHAHVSVSTVSRVINGHKGVDKATRRAVWQAVDALGYEVVRHSDALKGILVLSPTVQFGSTFWQLVVSGILNEASRHGLPVLFSSAATAQQARRDIESFASRDGVLGVITACFPTDMPVDGWVPDDPDIVSLSILMRGPEPTVNIDMYSATLKVVQYLIKTGHTRIAFAINSLRWWAQQQRQLGYMTALKESRLDPVHPTAEQHVPLDEVTPWLERQLAAPNPPTAIVAGTSELSRQLYAELHHRGVNMPGDISFVGVSHVTPWDKPLFDTISQPSFALGGEAVRRLQKLVSVTHVSVTKQLEAGLIHVGTTGPPQCNKRPV